MPSSELLFLLDPANQAFLGKQPSRRAVLRVRLGLLLLATILGLCLFGTAWAGIEWFRWLMLQGDSTTVSAQVVNRRKDDKTDGNPNYFVTYRYEAPSPTGPGTYTREQHVSRNTYGRLHTGQTVEVRYHNTFPSISSIADDYSMRNGISVGALMWLPVAVFMGWQIKRCRREIRLGKKGQVLSGRVISCTGARESEDLFQIELSYRFTAPGGQIIRGRETAYRDDLKEAPLPGPDTPLAVLYLDEKNYKVL